jgi:hypothetical protein
MLSGYLSANQPFFADSEFDFRVVIILLRFALYPLFFLGTIASLAALAILIFTGLAES